jgi:hypothetical protein
MFFEFIEIISHVLNSNNIDKKRLKNMRVNLTIKFMHHDTKKMSTQKLMNLKKID